MAILKSQELRFCLGFLLAVSLLLSVIKCTVHSTSLYDCQQDNIVTVLSECDTLKIGYTPQLDSQVVTPKYIYTFARVDSLTAVSMGIMLESATYEKYRTLDNIILRPYGGHYNLFIKATRLKHTRRPTK